MSEEETTAADMTVGEMQRMVDTYIAANGGYWDALSQMLRLVEEVGELSREINHRYGAKTKKASEKEKALSDEFGDVLFVLVATANATGVDLAEALQYVLHKYAVRDAGRWTKRLTTENTEGRGEEGRE